MIKFRFVLIYLFVLFLNVYWNFSPKYFHFLLPDFANLVTGQLDVKTLSNDLNSKTKFIFIPFDVNDVNWFYKHLIYFTSIVQAS